MLNLKNAKLGKVYKIQNINDIAPIKIFRRLFDLGFTCGQRVKLVRKSLLGKACLIEIRGFTLSLRSDIAEFVLLNEGETA